jgi:hypothetical protein
MARHLVFSAVAIAFSTALVTAVVQAEVPRRAAQDAAAIVPMKPHTGPLPPMQFEQYMARPAAVVQAVYEFAARHPEVLQYMPCYCGCQAFGHKGNHECFVRRRAADGRVLEWEPHGSGCAVCVDVGRDAMLMFNSGATVGAIRSAIDAKYGTRYASQTPTPRPR